MEVKMLNDTSELFTDDIELMPISRDEAKELPSSTQYATYNPLTDMWHLNIARKNDMAHFPHCYDKLEFYEIERV